MPELLRQHGIYTHLTTDHQHYFEDGGATYHQRYSSWQFARGQEGDAWMGQVADPAIPPVVTVRDNTDKNDSDRAWRQDWINRQYLTSEELQPQAITFAAGLDFMRRNAEQDNWFLQIETFDPHEPFFTQQHYKDLYPHDYQGKHFDWPNYTRVTETPDEVAHLRMEYAALVSMCDAYLGKVLDLMDELNLWDDTLLIVNTDHGFLLGEHDWWAKVVQPFYNEIARCPLFIWDPRARRQNERRDQLVQMIDMPATLLEYFGVPLPRDMQGLPLRATIASNAPTRDAILFGLFGAHVNLTDGRYVYMRAPVTAANSPLHEYTLMLTHMRKRFGVDELQELTLADPFAFTKGCRTLKVAGRPWMDPHAFGTLLFDIRADPAQAHPLDDPAVEAALARQMAALMAANDAPPEQFVRIGLPA